MVIAATRTGIDTARTVESDCHNESADHHTGSSEEHTEHHVAEVLKLGYVVCKAGYERARAEAIDVGEREALDLLVKVGS